MKQATDKIAQLSKSGTGGKGNELVRKQLNSIIAKKNEMKVLINK